MEFIQTSKERLSIPLLGRVTSVWHQQQPITALRVYLVFLHYFIFMDKHQEGVNPKLCFSSPWYYK